MIKRLGVLSWWLGVIVIALGLFSYINARSRINECDGLQRLDVEIDAGQAARGARYQAEHHLGNTLLDQATIDLNVPVDPRYTPEFVSQLGYCKSVHDDAGATALIVCVPLVLILWSLAFVLSGSFWLPAKS